MGNSCPGTGCPPGERAPEIVTSQTKATIVAFFDECTHTYPSAAFMVEPG